MSLSDQLVIKGEIGRKLMHVGILIIPLVYFFAGKDFSISLLIPITVFVVGVDYLRFKLSFLQKFFIYFFGWMLRSKEKDNGKTRLTGASNTLLAASIGIFFIPKEIFIFSFSVLSISDTLSSFVGRYFGKRNFFHKTFEGSLAFFLSGLFLIFVTPKLTDSFVEYLICAFGVAVGTLIEAHSFVIDDNFITPLAIGIFLMITYNIFFPQLQILSLF
ncbi:MAG: dolichol kinase [Bacteroidetes bacterium]|nr:dolichol kinase [Bacteroidota bacterium]